jgi:hypothetical protein
VSRRTGVLDPANTPVDTFATNDEVPIMMDGVIGVEVAAAVLAGAAANFNTATRLWTSRRSRVRSSRFLTANSTAPPLVLGSPSCA